jgi:Gpi18-like mannosyltransferase
VAKYGYQFTPGKQSSAAFFPLYPMAMRAAHLVIPGSSDLGWFVSGIIVANLSLLVALFYLVRLVRLDFGAGPARRVGVYLLVFPTAFFFSAVYSEATFLAVTAAAFYHARRGQWWIAGALGGLAALTRSPGILLCVPLLLEYMAQRDYQLRRIRLDIAALGLVPLCLAGLLLYFQWRFGNAFATRDAQAAWEGWGQLSWPWQPFVQIAQQKLVAKDLIDLTFALVLLGLSITAAVRLRVSYGVYAILSYWFVTAWGSLASVPRYALAVFPIFIVLALLGRSRLFHQAYLVSACALSAFFMMMFAVWRWVA